MSRFYRKKKNADNSNAPNNLGANQGTNKQLRSKNVAKPPKGSGSLDVRKTETVNQSHCVKEPCKLSIKHYRHRLADSEGYHIKYLIDAIVDSGILSDDNPRAIPQRPIEEHYQIPMNEPERIEITIESLDPML